MTIYAFVNQKGGVGKTTSCVNIGVGLAMTGRKVLLIDLDPQANLSTSLGVSPATGNVYDVLQGDKEFADIIISRPLQIDVDPVITLDVAPAAKALSKAEIQLSTVLSRETLLKRALSSEAEYYDYVLIDCSPSSGILTLNALTAAHRAIVPVQAEYLSLQGLAQLLESLQEIKVINEEMRIGGVIVTMYDGRRILNQDVKKALIDRFGDVVFDTPIRENIKVAEAPSHGLSVFEYDQHSYGSHDYAAAVQELIKQEMSHA